MISKRLLLQIGKELTGISLLFRVKKNGYKVDLVTVAFGEFMTKAIGITDQGFMDLSLNQLFNQKKINYTTKEDLLASFEKILQGKRSNSMNCEFLDQSFSKDITFKLVNIPILDSAGEVSHILHRIVENDNSSDGLKEKLQATHKIIQEIKVKTDMLFLDNPIPMAKISPAGDIEEVNNAFILQIFPLHSTNKNLLDIFDQVLDFELSNLLSKTSEGIAQELTMELEKNHEVKSFTVTFFGVAHRKKDVQLVAVFRDKTDLKRMRKDLIFKSILMEDCFRLKDIFDSNYESQELIERSINFFLTRFQAKAVTLWVRNQDSMGYELIFERVRETGYSLADINPENLLKESRSVSNNEAFLIRTSLPRKIDLKKIHPNLIAEFVVVIPSFKRDGRKFIMAISNDVPLDFGLEEKKIIGFMASCFFAEMATLYSSYYN